MTLASINPSFSFSRLGLILSLVLILNSSPASTDDKRPIFNKFEYPKRLYLQKDYYRAVSEILRLKFNYPEESVEYRLDLYLVKSYYYLKNYRQAEAAASSLVQVPAYRSNTPLIKEAGVWMSGALLKLNKEEKAALMWKKLVGESGEPFPSSQQIPGLIDPETAESLSIIPGLGLAACEEYGKAAVSFLLNALFVGATYHYFQNQEYAISALMLFFETGWYKGSGKAAREAAVKHNRRLIERNRKNWLRSQVNNLFPKRMNEFQIIYRNAPSAK